MPITDDPIAIGLLVGIAVLYYYHAYVKFKANAAHGGCWWKDGGGVPSDE